MKKSYIALIIISLVVIILVIAFLFATRDPSYDKTEIYSKEAVQEILDKSLDLENVYVSIGKDDENSFNYLKDNILKNVDIDEEGMRTITLKNLNENEGLIISEKDKKITKLAIPEVSLNTGYINLNNENYFKYLGVTKIDDRNAIAIKKEKDSNFVKKIFFIDKETGIVLKETEKTLFDNSDKVVRDYELDNVSDEDVEFVDYQKIYPDYEYIEEN